MIIEDSGEKTTGRHYVGKVLEDKKVQFERKEIRLNGVQVGDYIGMNEGELTWIVERKHENDFLKSCLDGRLSSQYEKLSDINGVPKFLLFEGNWDKLLFENKGLIGLLVSSRLKAAWYGISFQVMSTEKETAAFILALEKYADGFKEIHIKQMKPNLTKLKDERIRHLMVRGLGEFKASLLLEKFKSIDNIITLLKEDPSKLKTIRGIGEKLIENLNLIFLSKSEAIYDRDTGFNGTSVGKDTKRTSSFSHFRRNKKSSS